MVKAWLLEQGSDLKGDNKGGFSNSCTHPRITSAGANCEITA